MWSGQGTLHSLIHTGCVVRAQGTLHSLTVPSQVSTGTHRGCSQGTGHTTFSDCPKSGKHRYTQGVWSGHTTFSDCPKSGKHRYTQGVWSGHTTFSDCPRSGKHRYTQGVWSGQGTLHSLTVPGQVSTGTHRGCGQGHLGILYHSICIVHIIY